MFATCDVRPLSLRGDHSDPMRHAAPQYQLQSYPGARHQSVSHSMMHGLNRLMHNRVAVRVALAVATGGTSEVLIGTVAMVRDMGSASQSPQRTHQYKPFGVGIGIE